MKLTHDRTEKTLAVAGFCCLLPFSHPLLSPQSLFPKLSDKEAHWGALEKAKIKQAEGPHTVYRPPRGSDIDVGRR